MAKSSALELFSSLTIEEVRQQIAEVDGEIGVLEKKRDSLRTIEKAIDIRDNGKPKRGWSQKRKDKAAAKSAQSDVVDDEPENGHASSTPADMGVRVGGSGRQPSQETVDLRTKIYQLLRLEGPMGVADISRRVNVDYGKTQNALDGARTHFDKIGSKWSIKGAK